MDLNTLVCIMYFVQLTHSVEELSTGFPKRWFYRIFTPRSFLAFEIVHNIFWGAVVFIPGFPGRPFLIGLFALLMFANGVEHIVWFMKEKKYVPGLATAPIHVLLFAYYFLA